MVLFCKYKKFDIFELSRNKKPLYRKFGIPEFSHSAKGFHNNCVASCDTIYSTAVTSISTSPPLGSWATATAERAGKGAWKRVE